MEYRKLLFSRLIAAFLWAVVVQVFPLSLYVLLFNFDLVHPVEWFLKSAVSIFNFGTWVSLLPVHFLIFGIGYVSSQEHTKPRLLFASRFKYFWSCFNKSNALKSMLYFFLGVVISWTYLKFKHKTLLVECQNKPDALCLDDKIVFLISSGIWTSMYYFVRFDLLADKHLQFPIIKQVRFLQMRSKYSMVLHSCLYMSIVPIFYYFLFYLWYGKQVTVIFEVLISATTESFSFSGFSALLNYSLLIDAWILSYILFTTVEGLHLMILIHFTEQFSFALLKQPNNNSALLAAALGEQSIPIIQHLACYDLFNLSMSQKSNRQDIFTLSQPGGHPHTWNAIMHESLKIIQGFISEIDSMYKAPEPVEPKSPIPRHIHIRDMTIRHEEIFSGPVPLAPVSKIRSLVNHYQVPKKQENHLSKLDEVWTKVEALKEVYIQQNSVVKYIFGAKPDAKIRFLLSNAQPLVWVTQSISELAANALLEDQFGIVLKDLPLIINTLIELKFSLDKLGNIQRKLQKRDYDLCMKASLKSALRRSLYRIAIAYSDYLIDLPLSPQNLNCMQNFVKFREG